MKLLCLPKIEKGSRVGLVTPASSVDPLKAAAGIELLKKHGIAPVHGSHTFAQNEMVAGPVASRQADLYRFLNDDNISGIWAIRGGYGSAQLLETLDFSLFQEKQKLLIGFSDLTAFQWALFQQTGLPSLSGFALTLQVSEENPYLDAGMEIVFGNKRSIGWEDLTAGEVKIERAGEAEGILVGGTLSMICSLCGTPYWLEDDGEPLIFYVEDVHEPLYRLDRCIQQLQHCGFWDRVTGIILGKFAIKDDFLDTRSLFLERLPKDVPIVYDFPYGHFTESIPLPMGVRARMATDLFELSWESIIA